MIVTRVWYGVVVRNFTLMVMLIVSMGVMQSESTYMTKGLVLASVILGSAVILWLEIQSYNKDSFIPEGLKFVLRVLALMAGLFSVAFMLSVITNIVVVSLGLVETCFMGFLLFVDAIQCFMYFTSQRG